MDWDLDEAIHKPVPVPTSRTFCDWNMSVCRQCSSTYMDRLTLTSLSLSGDEYSLPSSARVKLW